MRKIFIFFMVIIVALSNIPTFPFVSIFQGDNIEIVQATEKQYSLCGYINGQEVENNEYIFDENGTVTVEAYTNIFVFVKTTDNSKKYYCESQCEDVSATLKCN